MPINPKPWLNYPAALTQLDAPALIGLEYRVGNYVGSSEIGVGVGAEPDFQVTQAGGGSLVVNVGSASGTLQRAFLPGDASGGTERYEYAGAQLTATITTANGTNPRIDMVTLAPPANVDQTVPQVLVVAGTPTAGATLANRNGAAALPAGRILLADVLVPVSSTSILTAQIQDRRGYPLSGVNPAVFSAADVVIPESTGGLQVITTGIVAGTNDNRQAAMLVWVPRRILAARIRWKYRQGPTAATSNYYWVVFDASGRQIANTSLTAFTGTTGVGATPNNAFVNPVQLEAGAYWIGFAAPVMGAGASVVYQGFQGVQNGVAIPGVAAPNQYAFAAGTTIGSLANTVGNTLGEAYNVVADTAAIPVPACALGA